MSLDRRAAVMTLGCVEFMVDGIEGSKEERKVIGKRKLPFDIKQIQQWILKNISGTKGHQHKGVSTNEYY